MPYPIYLRGIRVLSSIPKQTPAIVKQDHANEFLHQICPAEQNYFYLCLLFRIAEFFVTNITYLQDKINNFQPNFSISQPKFFAACLAALRLFCRAFFPPCPYRYIDQRPISWYKSPSSKWYPRKIRKIFYNKHQKCAKKPRQQQRSP